MPYMQTVAAALPTLGPVGHWPTYLQRTCPVPSWATEGVNVKDVDEFIFRLYGLVLAQLTAQMRAEQRALAHGHSRGSTGGTCPTHGAHPAIDAERLGKGVLIAAHTHTRVTRGWGQAKARGGNISLGQGFTGWRKATLLQRPHAWTAGSGTHDRRRSPWTTTSRRHKRWSARRR